MSSPGRCLARSCQALDMIAFVSFLLRLFDDRRVETAADQLHPLMVLCDRACDAVRGLSSIAAMAPHANHGHASSTFTDVSNR